MKNGSNMPVQNAPARFYKTVSVKEQGGGWQILLDGRPVKTPKRAVLLLPTQALAAAIAQEWDAQGQSIDPRSMPLTKLANTTLDAVAGREEAVRDAIAAYGANDLLCYRAQRPEPLAMRQAERWDPILAWAREQLGAGLVTTAGVMPVEQPGETLAQLRRVLAELDAFALSACHVMTTLTGSAVLTLALLRQRLTPEEAWAAAHLDEDFQVEIWGEDMEAEKRRALRWAEMSAAVMFYEASGV